MNRAISLLVAVSFALVLSQARLAPAGVPLAETFLYQGQLLDGGSAPTGEYDFKFEIWDTYILGSQVGPTLTRGGVTVTDGVFTVGLDFGAQYFDGQDLYLQIGVRPGPASDPDPYTTLTPRQMVTAAPYATTALHLTLPQDITVNTGDTALWIHNTGGGGCARFYIDNPSNTLGALYGSTNGSGPAVRGYNNGTGRAGYFDIANAANGEDALYAKTIGTGNAGYFEVYNANNNVAAVQAETNAMTGRAVHGLATRTGDYTNYGGYFEAAGDTGRGAFGQANGDDAAGLYGKSSGGSGVGVYGEATGDTGAGVYGYSNSTSTDARYGGYFLASGANAEAVHGKNTSLTGKALVGESTGRDGWAVYGEASGSYARAVEGRATSTSKDTVHYGGHFDAGGSWGVGVFGEAPSEEDGEKLGGDFRAGGIGGIGVRGRAMLYGGGFGSVAYGGLFETYASEGIGVYGKSWANYYGGAAIKGETIDGEGSYAIWGAATGQGQVIAGMFDGNVIVNGGLSVSGTKSFVHPHPTDPSKQIAYVCLEGGENGVYVRGSGQLAGGLAEVALPDHFALVASTDALTVQVTPTWDCKGIFVVEKSSERFVVQECAGGDSNATFDYLVMGVRAGFEHHDVIQENTQFRPDTGQTQETFEQLANHPRNERIKKLLQANGTLTDQGKLDTGTAAQAGWQIRSSQ